MSEFQAYFTIGIHHILSIEGLDHLLFIMVLACRFGWQQWRPLLVMVTAFTLGHTLSLVLGVLGLFVADSYVVELVIPATIIGSALMNTAQPEPAGRALPPLYILTALFGVVHGMGFGGSLRALLGSSQELAVPLLAFNLGIELAQIIVLVVVIGANSLLRRWLDAPRLAIAESMFAAGIAARLLAERY